MTREVYPMEDLRPTMVNTAQLPYDLELVLGKICAGAGNHGVHRSATCSVQNAPFEQDLFCLTMLSQLEYFQRQDALSLVLGSILCPVDCMRLPVTTNHLQVSFQL